MAARANEHLTAGPTRPAESQSPSDPALHPLLTRGAPEQREPHSLLTDIDWTPRGLQRLSGNRRPPAGQLPKSHQKATEGSPAHPRDPRTGTPAQQAQPPRRSKCASNDRAAHIRRRTRRARLPPPASEQRTTRRGTARHTTATTAPPETPAATLRYLTKHGEGPSTQSRPPPGRPDRASPS